MRTALMSYEQKITPRKCIDSMAFKSNLYDEKVILDNILVLSLWNEEARAIITCYY